MIKARRAQDFHIVFVLDESGSMTGKPWADLTVAVRSFLQIRLDAGASDVVSLILFDNSARIVCQSYPLDKTVAELPNFLHQKGGGTRFGPALNNARKVIELGLQYAYPPLLMFMSDGGASDGELEMAQLLHAVPPDSTELQVKTLAFGQGADVSKLSSLAKLGGGEFLLAINGLELKECFEQAAASLAHSF